MTIRLVVTRGFGNGTFNGVIPFVVTRGFTIGEEVLISPDCIEACQGIINDSAIAAEGGIGNCTDAVQGQITEVTAAQGLITSVVPSQGIIGNNVIASTGLIDDSPIAGEGKICH
jgi:hypothetical protein